MKEKPQQKGKSYAIAFLLIGTGFLPFFSASTPASIPSPLTEQVPAETIADETEYWALLVAVGVYAENPEEDRPDMLLEVDDLQELLLQSDWWEEDHIKVIKGKDATIINCIAGLRWLDRMEDSNDVSLVFFSTHGFPLGVDIPPRDEADGTDEALVSYWGFAFKNLFLWDDQLNVLLNRLESKGVCLIVDSCYAGGFNDPPNWNMTVGKASQTAAEWAEGFGEDVRGQNRVVLMASCEDEVSYSGGFAPYVIDGLRGYGDTNSDDVVSAEEAFYYAQPRSPHQNPTIYDGYDGDLPIMNLASPLSFLDTGRTIPLVKKDGKQHIDYRAVSTETSTLCGYVRGINTSIPIENAVVEVHGRINEYEWYENQTTTDSTGFFLMNTPAIHLRGTVVANGYFEQPIGPYEMQENQTIWTNISMEEHPTETARACGYITDETTGNPLENANISLSWESGQQEYHNETVSDVNGLYQMQVAPGIIRLEVEKDGFFSEGIWDLSIDESQTVWVNFSLNPHPAENAVMCGYLTDEGTGEPIKGIRIEFGWVDVVADLDYQKETQTDALGFYSITIAPGEVYIGIREYEYEFYDPYRHDAVENSTTWLNRSLSRSTFDVEITKPLKALYRNNERIIPLIQTRIIGPIDIAAEIPRGWFEPGIADHVEFYLDDVLQATDTTLPYNWTWTQKSFGKHVIKVIAYDLDGESASEELEVWKFL